ncbi:hypothetical protein SAMN04488125_107115 [Methylorubrum salsuginis]|uniref:Uncharacterized protein n=1 Tax=Methylorubrum salsuginis TaxID=414703 RepID=A0A1I4E650_9HYPH|nr:hypothetical protein SAMN04488125_107115 [Methylorubrum salsuginis]
MRTGQGTRDHERMDDSTLRAWVREALDDPSPAVLAEQVFVELHALHEAHLKAARSDT